MIHAALRKVIILAKIAPRNINMQNYSICAGDGEPSRAKPSTQYFYKWFNISRSLNAHSRGRKSKKKS